MAKSQLGMFESELLRSILGIAGVETKNEEKEKGKAGEAVLSSVFREVPSSGSRSTRPSDPKRLK